ncbi:MAG: 30S ribosomal protein S17 [Alphaproteobacteria bacterium]|nr:30S ribosomal protein S17 [Alphaproteobacteria bacterium]
MQKKTTTNTVYKKKLNGVVVSTAMKDTAIVEVAQYKKHPRIGKYYTVSKRYKVHNPHNTVATGDKVSIISCRPISKSKSFMIHTQ